MASRESSPFSLASFRSATFSICWRVAGTARRIRPVKEKSSLPTRMTK
jgi:hypothetical protein